MSLHTICANCNHVFERESMVGFADTVDNDVSIADLVADIFLCGDKTRLYEQAGCSADSTQRGERYVGFKFCKPCVDTLVTCFKCRNDFLDTCDPVGFIRTILHVHDVSKVLERDVKLKVELEDTDGPDSPDPEYCGFEPGSDDIESPEHLGVDEQLAISIRSQVVKEKQELYERYGLKQCSVVLNRLSESDICKTEVDFSSHGDEEPLLMFTCNLCARTFPHKAQLILHIQLDHEMTTSRSSSNRFSCRLCPRTFSNRNSFLGHTYLHTKEKRNVACSVKKCKYFSTRVADVRRHMQTVHNIHRNFPHIIKSKQARTRKRAKYWNRHVPDIESAHKDFKCKQCDYGTFQHKAELLVHTQFDHCEPNKPVPTKICCCICQKIFLSRRAILQHMFSHTKERRFVCHVQECHYFSSRKAEVNRHMKMKHNIDPPPDAEPAHNENLKCEQCDQIFQHKAELLMHTQFDHLDLSDQRPTKFCCRMCPKVFKTRRAILQHTYSHTKERPFVCEVAECGYFSSRKQQVKLHMKMKHNIDLDSTEAEPVPVHDGNLQCEQCDQIFQHKAELLIHTQLDHLGSSDKRPTKFCCRMCRKVFKTRRALLQHTYSHTKERPFVCEVEECGYFSSRKQQVKLHMKMKHNIDLDSTEAEPVREHDGNLQCEQCGKMFPHKAELLIHSQFDHLESSDKRPTKFCCRTCPKMFNKRLSLLKHTYSHTKERPLVCEVAECKYSASRQILLKRHMQKKHNIGYDIVGDAEPEEPEPVPRNHKCDQCERLFLHKAELILHNQFDHLRPHERPPETFCCLECLKVYSTRRILLHHTFKHTKEKLFICRKKGCPYVSSRKVEFERHMKMKHNIDSKSTLPINNEENKEAMTIPEHARSSKESFDSGTNDNEPVENHFNCEQCHETFLHSAMLILHNRFDHRPAEESDTPAQYECRMCPKIYSTRDCLLRHTLFHTKEKNFECRIEQCQFVANKVSTLRHHIFNAHPDYYQSKDDSTDESPSPYLKVPKKIPIVPTFKCHFKNCSSNFNLLANLLAHTAKIHLPRQYLNTFPCSFCDTVLNLTEEVDQHMFLHTGESGEGANRNVSTGFLIEEVCGACRFKEDNSKYIPGGNLAYLQHDREYHCIVCALVSKKAKDIKSHFRAHMKERLLCEICAKTFTHPHSLKSHRKIFHENVQLLPRDKSWKRFCERIQTPNTFSCEVAGCEDTQFNFQAEMLFHNWADHNPSNFSSESKSFQCSMCSHKTPYRQNMRAHFFKHTKEDRFRCSAPLCTFRGYFIQGFKIHVRTQHPQ